MIKNFLLCLLTMAGITTACTAKDEGVILSPSDFVARFQADTTACILDVRTAQEYAQGHLPSAINIDYLSGDSFAAAVDTLDKNRTYYVYCQSGRRSRGAVALMKSKGLRVFELKGGYMAWTAWQNK